MNPPGLLKDLFWQHGHHTRPSRNGDWAGAGIGAGGSRSGGRTIQDLEAASTAAGQKTSAEVARVASAAAAAAAATLGPDEAEAEAAAGAEAEAEAEAEPERSAASRRGFLESVA